MILALNSRSLCIISSYNFICIYKLCFLFHFKIVGHSLGGGTAALLTYILREQKELSSTTCVTFAPGTYQSNMMLTFPFEHIQSDN